MKSRFISSLAAVVLAGCASVADTSYSYNPGGAQALVLTHHDNTRTTLVPIDMTTGKITGDPVIIGREGGTILQYSKDRLTDYHLNTLEFPTPAPIGNTGYDPNYLASGTYAYVGTKGATIDQMTGTRTTVTVTDGCFPEAAYIIEIDSQKVNFLERIGKFRLRQKIGDAADQARDPIFPNLRESKDELARVKFTLEEFPNVKGEVVRPNVLGKVKFDNATNCKIERGDTFTVIHKS